MRILEFLENIRNPVLDQIFLQITRFGEEMIIILVFCLLFWCICKKTAYVLGVVFFMSSIIVQGLKIVFRWARPWYDGLTYVAGARGEATGYTFPSGHTQNAAALLGSLGAMSKYKSIKIIFFVLIILVAFSRMYLGVHYLSDVVASLVITFAVLFVAVRFVAQDEVCIKRELIISGILIAVSVMVLVYAAVLYRAGTSAPHMLQDSTRAAGAAIGFAIGMFIERMYINFSVKVKDNHLQILKFAIGIAVTLGIQEVFRFIRGQVSGEYIDGTALIIDVVRYFTLPIWIVVVYPLIIKKFFEVKT